MPPHPLIALLTDFGTRDAYVGVMKGVMKSICPDCTFIDITHDIPPQDVRAAAFTLRNNYRFFPEDTVFLVVVDPGVGTARRAVLWQSQEGYSFVAPDNGVLSYILPGVNGRSEPVGISWEDGAMRVNIADQLRPHMAWDITGSPLHGVTSATFHGRDIFAPAAALAACHLLDTPTAQRILKRIEMATLARLPLPHQATSGDEISGEVLYIDHFGNIVTSIGRLIWRGIDGLVFDPAFKKTLPQLIFPPESRVGVGPHMLDQINRTYGEVAVGDLLALVGSSGYLEISVNGGNAADRLNVKVGDNVTIYIPEGV